MFPTPVQIAPGATQPHIQWVPGAFPGVKRPERGVDLLPQSSTEVKERAELSLYSPFTSSLQVTGFSLPFYQFRSQLYLITPTI